MLISAKNQKKNVFSIVIKSDRYNNIDNNNIIQYCDISDNNRKKTKNTRLIIKLLNCNNTIKIIYSDTTNNNKKTIYQSANNLYYNNLYKIIENKFLYTVTVIYCFKLEQ